MQLLHVFEGFSKGFILENRLQDLNGVTDFSQRNFLQIIEHGSH